VWRLNLAWKSGHPNQCLRLGDDAKTDRTVRARFREGASYSNPLNIQSKRLLSCCILLPSHLYRHVAYPIRSIETHSLPALTRSCPRGFTLITRAASWSRQLPWLRCRLTRAIPDRDVFYVVHPIRSIQALNRRR